MFDKPTINDFLGLLRTDTNRSLELLGREADALVRQFNANGMYRSGSMVRALLDAAEATFRQRLEAAMVVMRRTVQDGELDAREVRDATVQHLQQFPTLIRNASGVDRVVEAVDAAGVDKIVADHFAKLAEHLRFQVRQFDIGWAGREESEADSFVNTGTIIGGVQQRSPGANITVQATINVTAAREAAETLAAELIKSPQDVPIIDMRADVDTLRAQLTKSSPSTAVLQEVGRTLRSLGEGVAAGMLTQPAITALAALLTALGIS
jgi:hypothetical protein